MADKKPKATLSQAIRDDILKLGEMQVEFRIEKDIFVREEPTLVEDKATRDAYRRELTMEISLQQIAFDKKRIKRFEDQVAEYNKDGVIKLYDDEAKPYLKPIKDAKQLETFQREEIDGCRLMLTSKDFFKAQNEIIYQLKAQPKFDDDKAASLLKKHKESMDMARDMRCLDYLYTELHDVTYEQLILEHKKNKTPADEKRITYLEREKTELADIMQQERDGKPKPRASEPKKQESVQPPVKREGRPVHASEDGEIQNAGPSFTQPPSMDMQKALAALDTVKNIALNSFATPAGIPAMRSKRSL